MFDARALVKSIPTLPQLRILVTSAAFAKPPLPPAWPTLSGLRGRHARHVRAEHHCPGEPADAGLRCGRAAHGLSCLRSVTDEEHQTKQLGLDGMVLCLQIPDLLFSVTS